MLKGVIPNVNNKQGSNIIKANIIGNSTVQQYDISWSKRILGNEALTHINTNTIKKLFIPITSPYITFSKIGLCKYDSRESFTEAV